MAQTSLSAKLLSVLGSFSAERPELTLSELSRRSGLPLTTTHRIVMELTAWGALERGDKGPYRIGLRMLEVGSLAPRGLPLREVALPYMEDLYEATHENVVLGVREGTEVLSVERLAGRRSVPIFTRVGGRFALHATGVGLVLLAFAPHEVQEQVLREPLERWTEKTICDPKRLRRILADVRRTGIATSDRQVSMDTFSVAAPIYGPDDTVVAALSLIVFTEDGSQGPSLEPAVRSTARSISRALGSARALRHPQDAWRGDQ